MKKKMIKGLALAVIGMAFAAGNAMALPTLASGYSWNENDFWTLTDFTTNATGTQLFQIQVENASYESNFGLYTVDDHLNPGSIVNTFEVFSRNEEPFTMTTITWWDDNGSWKISDAFTGNTADTTWTDFGREFGFYYDVDAGNNGDIDYTFYTYEGFNTADTGVEHILTAYNDTVKSVYVYLDDQLAGGADADYNDMTVFANDIQPVPEPATMLLFGTGLAGLTGLARRRRSKE